MIEHDFLFFQLVHACGGIHSFIKRSEYLPLYTRQWRCKIERDTMRSQSRDVSHEMMICMKEGLEERVGGVEWGEWSS